MDHVKGHSAFRLDTGGTDKRQPSLRQRLAETCQRDEIRLGNHRAGIALIYSLPKAGPQLLVFVRGCRHESMLLSALLNRSANRNTDGPELPGFARRERRR